MASQTDIQTLIDTQAIAQLVARYGRAVDWLDIEAMKACFDPSATVRFGANEIPAHGFCDFWGGMGGGFKARHHLLGAPVIDFTGADSAYVEAPAIVAGTRADEGTRLRDFMECNRYCFTAVRADGKWVFSGANVFITWSQGAPTTTGMEAGAPLDHDVSIAHPAFRALA